MTMSEFYALLAVVAGILTMIGCGIGFLIYYIVKAVKRSHSQPCEVVPEPQETDVSAAKGELLADASAKSLQLDMAMIEAANRMNAAVSEEKV